MFGYLPDTLEIGGIEYEINSDFRVCIATLMMLEDDDLSDDEKIVIMMVRLFGEESIAKITEFGEACRKTIWFLNCGRDSEPREDGFAIPSSLIMDWEQDERLIFAGIAKTVGRDIRADEYCHFWSFMAYFMGMGECAFTTVKSIRYKIARHQKLEKWEQVFYRENREIIDIRKNIEKGERLFNEVFGLGQNEDSSFVEMI